MSAFMGELIGTMILVYLGCGVVANVSLKGTKGAGAGFSIVPIAWGLSLALAIYAVGGISGAHLNPAVTLGFAMIGEFAWSEVSKYLLAQMIGAFIGAVIVYVQYLPHLAVTDDKEAKLGVFAPLPAIRNPIANAISELIGTFTLVFGILILTNNEITVGLTPLIIGGLLATIGLTLGGTTGFSINPARDLGPRIAHAILPIPGKGKSDWGYAWVTIIAPLIGGIYGAVFYKAVFAQTLTAPFWIFTIIVIVFAIAAVGSVLSKKQAA